MSVFLPQLPGKQINNFTQHNIIMFGLCFCKTFSLTYSHKENDFPKYLLNMKENFDFHFNLV